MYNPMWITLGVEDALSEAVARRLVKEYLPGSCIGNVLGRGGNNVLKSRLNSLNQIAQHIGPVIIITDLDNPSSCPAELVADWTGNLRVSSNFLMRVAVMEIEAWVIADRHAFANWLGIPDNIVPRNSEDIADPKQALIELTRQSRMRDLRQDIVKSQPDGLFSQGIGYNDRLKGFVSDHWQPDRARQVSASLDKAIRRIAEISRDM